MDAFDTNFSIMTIGFFFPVYLSLPFLIARFLAVNIGVLHGILAKTVRRK